MRRVSPRVPVQADAVVEAEGVQADLEGAHVEGPGKKRKTKRLIDLVWST